MDRQDLLSRMPDDFVTDLLSGYDLPEVAEFRAMCRHLNRVTSSDDFSIHSNAMSSRRSFWTITHYRSARNPRLGWINAVREEDGRVAAFGLQRYHLYGLPVGRRLYRGRVVNQGEVLTLICVFQSILLFRISGVINDGVALLVLNLSNGSTRRIECPSPLFSSQSFTIFEHIKIVVNPDNHSEYVIIYVEYLSSRVYYYEYNSQPAGWSQRIQAVEVSRMEMLNVGNPRAMMLLLSLYPRITLFITTSLGDGILSVMAAHHPALAQIILEAAHVPDDDQDDDDPDALAPIYYRLYSSRGSQGYLVSVERVDANTGPFAEVLQRIMLFRLNPAWTHYEIVSRVPDEIVPHQDFDHCSYHLEEIDGFVNLTMSNSRFGVWGYFIFRYDTRAGVWTFIQNRDGVAAGIASRTFITRFRLMPE